MELKYRESEYGRTINLHGFQTKYENYELYILTKYYHLCLGKSYKETKDLIYEFCNKNIKDFNEVTFFNIINKAIAKAKRNKYLIDIKTIEIIDTEIEFIKNLDISQNAKNYLFSLLIQNKIYNKIHLIKGRENTRKNYISNIRRTLNEIKRNSNIPSNIKIDSVKKELIDNDLIEPILISCNLHLKFLNSIKPSNKIVLEISDVEHSGFIFMKYCNDPKIGICDKCKSLFYKKRNDSRYCNSCSKNRYNKVNTKTIECIDCKKKIQVNGIVKKQNRCKECYLIYRKKYNKMKKREIREIKCQQSYFKL